MNGLISLYILYEYTLLTIQTHRKRTSKYKLYNSYRHTSCTLNK